MRCEELVHILLDNNTKTELHLINLCPCSESCPHLGAPEPRRCPSRHHWALPPWTDLDYYKYVFVCKRLRWQREGWLIKRKLFFCIVTFGGMQIYFHSGVSPGVQDLPGNNIHYGHPVEDTKNSPIFTVFTANNGSLLEQKILLSYFSSKNRCTWKWKM